MAGFCGSWCETLSRRAVDSWAKRQTVTADYDKFRNDDDADRIIFLRVLSEYRRIMWHLTAGALKSEWGSLNNPHANADVDIVDSQSEGVSRLVLQLGKHSQLQRSNGSDKCVLAEYLTPWC